MTKYLILFLAFVTMISPSYATSCHKDYASLEMAYLKADVIFSGYVVPNNEKNIIEFEVTELFKDRFRGSEFPIEKLKYKSNHYGKIDPSVEYIFYGELSSGHDNSLIWTLGCSRTQATPEEKIRLLKSLEENSDNSSLIDILKAPLVFKGRVIRREVSEWIRQEKPFKGKHNGKATIEFEILETYKNDGGFVGDAEISTVSVGVGKCFKGYELGGEYLLFVYRDTVRAEVGFEERYSTICIPHQGVNYVDEKIRLRNLSALEKFRGE